MLIGSNDSVCIEVLKGCIDSVCGYADMVLIGCVGCGECVDK